VPTIVTVPTSRADQLAREYPHLAASIQGNERQEIFIQAAPIIVAVLTAVAVPAVAESQAPRLPTLVVDAQTHPNLAENISHAQAAGHPRILTYNGPGSPQTAANRAAATDGIPKIVGTTRDEYPFASTAEGGAGSWVGHIGPPEHPYGQGALLRNFYARENLKAGDPFSVKVINLESR
jgi:hypothetical protein